MSYNQAAVVRVLVIESNPVFRCGLEALLSAGDGLQVVAAVPGVEHIGSVVSQHRPDVVVLGLNDRGDEAGEVGALLNEVLGSGAALRVVVLAHGGRSVEAKVMLRGGVRGYLPKDISSDHLASVVREVCREDEKVFLSAPRSVISSIMSDDRELLSGREREVISLVAQAMTNAQIARTLCIAKGTVKRHLHNIFAKLNAVSRVDAVNKARAAMLITDIAMEAQHKMNLL
uniref:DacT3 n=1 Tax=Dactylosporangium sp. SC14051 TaxID=1239282 RepID=K4IK20_9ACTN|nr:DacT3 [Dactylosporangium sp. SC14051]